MKIKGQLPDGKGIRAAGTWPAEIIHIGSAEYPANSFGGGMGYESEKYPDGPYIRYYTQNSGMRLISPGEFQVKWGGCEIILDDENDLELHKLFMNLAKEK